MVETTNAATLDYPPLLARLDRSTVRGVLLQGQVGSGPVVVVQVPGKDAFQMALSQNNHVIEALTSYRADDSFRIGILPR